MDVPPGPVPAQFAPATVHYPDVPAVMGPPVSTIRTCDRLGQRTYGTPAMVPHVIAASTCEQSNPGAVRRPSIVAPAHFHTQNASMQCSSLSSQQTMTAHTALSQSIPQNQVHHIENQTTVAPPSQSTPDPVMSISPQHTNSQTNTNARTENTTPKTVDGPERGRPRIARATARSEKRSESARPYKKSTSRSSSRANVNKHFDTVVLPCAINSTASQQVSNENQSEPDPPPTPTRQATTDGQNLGQ